MSIGALNNFAFPLDLSGGQPNGVLPLPDPVVGLGFSPRPDFVTAPVNPLPESFVPISNFSNEVGVDGLPRIFGGFDADNVFSGASGKPATLDLFSHGGSPPEFGRGKVFPLNNAGGVALAPNGYDLGSSSILADAVRQTAAQDSLGSVGNSAKTVWDTGSIVAATVSGGEFSRSSNGNPIDLRARGAHDLRFFGNIPLESLSNAIGKPVSLAPTTQFRFYADPRGQGDYGQNLLPSDASGPSPRLLQGLRGNVGDPKKPGISGYVEYADVRLPAGQGGGQILAFVRHQADEKSLGSWGNKGNTFLVDSLGPLRKGNLGEDPVARMHVTGLSDWKLSPDTTATLSGIAALSPQQSGLNFRAGALVETKNFFGDMKAALGGYFTESQWPSKDHDFLPAFRVEGALTDPTLFGIKGLTGTIHGGAYLGPSGTGADTTNVYGEAAVKYRGKDLTAFGQVNGGYLNQGRIKDTILAGEFGGGVVLPSFGNDLPISVGGFTNFRSEIGNGNTRAGFGPYVGFGIDKNSDLRVGYDVLGNGVTFGLTRIL